MSHLEIIRAWKDEAYRLSLSEKQQAMLPAHPAGLIELTDADLAMIAGGMNMQAPTIDIPSATTELAGVCGENAHRDW